MFHKRKLDCSVPGLTSSLHSSSFDGQREMRGQGILVVSLKNSSILGQIIGVQKGAYFRETFNHFVWHILSGWTLSCRATSLRIQYHLRLSVRQVNLMIFCLIWCSFSLQAEMKRRKPMWRGEMPIMEAKIELAHIGNFAYMWINEFFSVLNQNLVSYQKIIMDSIWRFKWTPYCILSGHVQ